MGLIPINQIPDGARVLLDTVTVIYFLEDHLRHGRAATRLLRRIEKGEVEGVMATLVLTELLVPLYRDDRASEAAGLARQLANFRNMVLVDLDQAIAREAARLRARLNLRTPDAIHGATAIVTGCAGLATNDKRLDALAGEGLKVWSFDMP